jgi:hypothetical protein
VATVARSGCSAGLVAVAGGLARGSRGHPVGCRRGGANDRPRCCPLPSRANVPRATHGYHAGGAMVRMKCGESTGYDPTAAYCWHNWL